MKKYVILLCALFICIFFTGCLKEETGLTEDGIGINVYYLN